MNVTQARPVCDGSGQVKDTFAGQGLAIGTQFTPRTTPGSAVVGPRTCGGNNGGVKYRGVSAIATHTPYRAGPTVRVFPP
jgi:hypothetical protein